MDIFFGGLIEFGENENIESFMDKIDNKNAIRILETSITFALKSGAFDLSEAYILYKCLSKIKEKNDKDESKNI